VNFGFNTKYKKGEPEPTGSTQVSFSAGGLNFHSEAYEWLALDGDGGTAQYHGSGTVNGEASPTGELYKFTVWAKDGIAEADDTFRIMIWYEDGGDETIIYDNGSDQVIGGGSIVIHGK
jgi:hypothetical protein